MDKPSTPSRSTILNADCRITDLLTWPSSWAVAAVDRSVPTARAPGAVRCFVIAASLPFGSFQMKDIVC
jgi:hypothetical protein